MASLRSARHARPLPPLALLLVGLLCMARPSASEEPVAAGEPTASTAPFSSPFLGAGGEVRTLVRPEFRDVPSLMEDLALFGVEGLTVEAIGPWLASADPKAGPVAGRLLLRGAPQVVSRGREVLRYLDTPKPAVFVSMLAAEVRFVGTKERGGFLDVTRDVPGAPDSLFRGLYSSFEPESYMRASLTGYMPFQGTNVRFGSSLDDIFENGAYELVLRLLAEERYAEFLAWPTVLCTEGLPGEVESVNLTYHRRVALSGSRLLIDDAPTVTGIRLRVVPVRIAKDAAVLDLIADIGYEEEERTSSTPAADVVVRQRRVVTRVTVRDREAMLIGGIKLKRRIEDEQGIPLVRSVPGVELVTSSSNRDAEETELILMIRPRIRVPGAMNGPYLPPGEARRHRRASKDETAREEAARDEAACAPPAAVAR